MIRDEQIREVIDALTNGVGEKPYYRRNAKTNDVEVFVADDCLLCIVPAYDPDNDPEGVAKAICEAGLMLQALLKEQPCETCGCIGGNGMIDRPTWDVSAPNDGKDIHCPECSCKTYGGSKEVHMLCVECPIVEKDQCFRNCPTKPCPDCKPEKKGSQENISQLA